MIIGNGLLAKAFKGLYEENDEIIIFASGVSNSSETELQQFSKEIYLLEESLKLKKKIIYFSSTSILCDPLLHTPYQKHKKKIENLLESNDSIVVRLPQVLGFKQNKLNLLPYLYYCISNKIKFPLYINQKKNILDIEDVVKITDFIIKNDTKDRKIFNVINTTYYSVYEIVREIEYFLNVKSIFYISEKKDIYKKIIPDKFYLDTLETIGISFDDKYLSRVIKKYLFS